jgi:LysM repeat protein
MKQSISTIIIFAILFLFLKPAQAGIIPADSLGIRKVGNQSYIIHRVEKGENLYRLSLRYGVQVNDIVSANPGADKSIQVGQELRIPHKSQVVTAPVTTPVTTPPQQQTQKPVQQPTQKPVQTQTQNPRLINQPSETGKIEHVVRAGETLFSIAGKYDVSVDNIKKWNSLRSNTLAIGDRLAIYINEEQAAEINEMQAKRENNGKKVHIVNRGETLFSIANNYNISTDDLISWNRLEDNSIYVGQELVIGFTDSREGNAVITSELKVDDSRKEDEQVKRKEMEGTNMVKVEDKGEYKKITEKGIAKVIEGSEETKKYLALHRSAPIGTIMQVKNEMNDLSVFVRVIGKLPETGDNANILLKISKTAYDRLGAYDSQFPVEITYHP